MTTPQQNESFVRSLVMACITGCIPFTFIENPHLIEAAKAIGVTLPSRKVLSTTVLDAAFKDIQTATDDQLSKLKYIDAASDGWRKKYCEQGAGLVNFCALTATGALLHDVLNCSAVRKDADGIADMLLDAAEKMSGGDCGRIAGWILDNTKANWAAMKQLATEHPDWIMRGCIAHGLALAMKDFTKFTAGRGQAAKQNTWGLKWAEATLAAANKIANYINDSPAAKQQVRSSQLHALPQPKEASGRKHHACWCNPPDAAQHTIVLNIMPRRLAALSVACLQPAHLALRLGAQPRALCAKTSALRGSCTLRGSCVQGVLTGCETSFKMIHFRC